MILRPIAWLTRLPLVALPLLAAGVLQARFFTPEELYWRGMFFIPATHWLWIVVAAALGVWVGWHTALPQKTPEQP